MYKSKHIRESSVTWLIIIKSLGPIQSIGDRGLGDHRLMKRLVVWRHQANVDLSSVVSSTIYLKTIALRMFKKVIISTRLKITHLKSKPHNPAADDLSHDDVTKWKHFPRYWPFVRGIHRSPVNSLHKGQWRGALMISLICVWINSWENNREAGDLTRNHAHYDVIVMCPIYRVVSVANNQIL